MFKQFLIPISSLLIICLTVNAHTLLGFDTTVPFLDQDFYDCVAGRLNYNQKAFAIVPYDPSGDFADEVAKAKKAGFREVHLLLDPEDFPFVNLEYLPEQLLQALQGKGTFVAGFWVKVSKDARFFRRKQSSWNKLSDLLIAFEEVFSQYGRLSVGVYTTASDWIEVFGKKFDESEYSGNIQFKYWAGYNEDPVMCDTRDPNNPGKSICHIQQIQYANTACGAPFNVNIKRVANLPEEL